MSGFVLVLEKSGAPCDRALLEKLTGELAFRGPDGCRFEACGPVGLGAAMFHTTAESAGSPQPLSIDGSVWIVGEVRLDDRSTLVDRLRGAGCEANVSEADLRLLLKAYSVWGDECVEHILGDFSFALWDERRRRVFGARDHFGIRPLFYVDNSRILALSNTLECLRRHPAVDTALDELNLADALLFGRGQDPAASAFRQIRRLEAAHRIVWSTNQLSKQRYWELPCYTEPLRFRNPSEYVERFKDLLRSAVADRLRVSSVALELTGGVDSTCVAAAASDLRRPGKSNVDLHAWTANSPQVLPLDREAEFAGLAADALGITHRIFCQDEYLLFRKKSGELIEPGSEPRDLSLLAVGIDYFRAIRAHARVLLTGQGGDGVFAGSPLYFQRLLRSGRWDRALWETVSYTVSRRRLPPFGIRSRVKRFLGLRPAPPKFPEWIRPELVARFQLRQRWTDSYDPVIKLGRDLRQEAARHLRTPWDSIFAGYDDVGLSGTPIDVRHPLFDLRIVSFLLQTPPLPWLANKDLVRMAWPRELPAEIRQRPKFPLQGNPLMGRIMRGEVLSPTGADSEHLADFIDADRLPTIHRGSSGMECWMVACTTSVGIWLNHLESENIQ